MILGIDPGSDKTGLAILDREGKVQFREIVSQGLFKAKIEELLQSYPVETVVLGDGTHSSETLARLKEVGSPPVKLIDESYTTFEAEKRYQRERLTGLKKVLRFINWKPDKPLDDYVAVILVERYLEKSK